MNLQPKDKFVLPGLDKPISEFLEKTDRRMRASAIVNQIESAIYKKIHEFQKATGRKARYVIMDENTKTKLSVMKDMANFMPLDHSLPTRLMFNNLPIVVVHGRGEGIQIGC
ncbi:hypothetical protein SHANETTE_133 [Bacillus phage Shanette]|uniref:Uncharacterized protein n=2 Tax=Siminovitchvirus TaxID=1918721 RepID=S5M4U9_9CAUD|nr:hypothetical protein AVV47_gp164 [Bacillus phage JL]YP_009216128.1 hypothetical protein AVV46_gp164 [Bacillus phage Shanette]AGR46911.1 hypothetical protein JL_132 [Bacillus phage JL]AGR47027.1 hypothetical protein SHANETTE_133 [Bacillus phage Shanette]